MKLNCFLMCDAAAVLPDGTLQIGRVIDSVKISTNRRLTDEERKLALPIPSVTFVAMFEGSIADGLRHTVGFEFVDEDEEVIAPERSLGDLIFTMNPLGRALRHHQIVQIDGLRVPSPGDYTARLYLDGKVFATYTFYVILHEPNG